MSFNFKKITFFNANETYAQSPTELAKGFNIFIENNVTLNTNESEGSIACGNDLTIQGNYQIATNYPGDSIIVGEIKLGSWLEGKSTIILIT